LTAQNYLISLCEEETKKINELESLETKLHSTDVNACCTCSSVLGGCHLPGSFISLVVLDGFAVLLYALFVWLFSHQPALLFSQNKPAISQQYFPLTTNQHQPSATCHRPNEQAGNFYSPTRRLAPVVVNPSLFLHVT
jgi:hypothetical protein